MTETQALAIKALVPLLDEHALMITQEEGGVLFLNNLAVLHAREDFVDAPGSTRHVLRMYMSDPARSWENATADTSDAQKICSMVSAPSED